MSPPVPRHWSNLWTDSRSHWFPPLSEHVVDELGHGLGAAGASSALLGFAAQAGVLHHLGEDERHLLVVLGHRQLVELAAVLGSQALTLLSLDLPHVAQVLLVAHQKYERVHVPVGQRQCSVRLQSTGFALRVNRTSGLYYITLILLHTSSQIPAGALWSGARWLWPWGRRSGRWYHRPKWNHRPSGSGRVKQIYPHTPKDGKKFSLMIFNKT